MDITNEPIDPASVAGVVLSALRIANAAVVADIESNCVSVLSACGSIRWYDTRPMLDPREHSPELVDMAHEAIEYGVKCRLLFRHPLDSWMVRIAQGV
jgi:hypothetical protein